MCMTYFYNNVGKCCPIFYSVTVAFSDELEKKLEYNFPPNLKSVAALPCKIRLFDCVTFVPSLHGHSRLSIATTLLLLVGYY